MADIPEPVSRRLTKLISKVLTLPALALSRLFFYIGRRNLRADEKKGDQAPMSHDAGEAAAVALDEAIDGARQGKPIDRDKLLARHPQLDAALAVLDRLQPTATTVSKSTNVIIPPNLPERIGPFEVECKLGSGHFGDVYKAYDRDVKRWFAVKVLKVARLDEEECVKRFQREAEATARLRHRGGCTPLQS
jgi:hypothetical protein